MGDRGGGRMRWARRDQQRTTCEDAGCSSEARWSMIAAALLREWGMCECRLMRVLNVSTAPATALGVIVFMAELAIMKTSYKRV
jgi:hypothetical protein